MDGAAIDGKIYSLTDPRELAKFPRDFLTTAIDNIENERFDAPFMTDWFVAQGYIGKTTTALEKRLGKHIYEARSKDPKKECHKNNWLRKLERENIKPVITLILDLDKTSKHELNLIEIESIAFFRKFGGARLNTTNGGEGFDSESGKRASAIYLATYTVDQRRRIAKKSRDTLGPDGRHAACLKAVATLGEEGLKKRAAKIRETRQAKRTLPRGITIDKDGFYHISLNVIEFGSSDYLGYAWFLEDAIQLLDDYREQFKSGDIPEKKPRSDLPKGIRWNNERHAYDVRTTIAEFGSHYFVGRRATLPDAIELLEGFRAKYNSDNMPEREATKNPYPPGITWNKEKSSYHVATTIADFGFYKHVGYRKTLPDAIQLLDEYSDQNDFGNVWTPEPKQRVLPIGINMDKSRNVYKVRTPMSEFGESRFIGRRKTLPEAIRLLDEYKERAKTGKQWVALPEQDTHPKGIAWDKSRNIYKVYTPASEFGERKYIGCHRSIPEAVQLLEDYRLQRRQSDVDPDNEK